MKPKTQLIKMVRGMIDRREGVSEMSGAWRSDDGIINFRGGDLYLMENPTSAGTRNFRIKASIPVNPFQYWMLNRAIKKFRKFHASHDGKKMDEELEKAIMDLLKR